MGVALSIPTMISRLIILLALTISGSQAWAAKRVLVLYSTGGHSTAARSVEKLLNEHPEEFEVIRHDFAEELSGFARWFYFGGYDLISQKANWINRLGVRWKWFQADRQEIYASERFNAHFNQPERIREYVEKVKPDIIISTHFSVADTLAMLREQGHFKNIPIAWTHLDVVDNVFFRQIGDQLDMSFLPTQEMEASWREVIDAEKLSAAGIPIMPELLDKTPGDGSAVRREMGLDPTHAVVMLMGGSMGALSYELILRETAKRFGTEKVQFIAICGRNTAKADSLNAWSRTSDFPKNATLTTTGFIDTTQVRRLQDASDLIISKPGGLTTFELLTTGKPVIMAEGIGLQEKYNAGFVEKEGAALFFPQPKGRIGEAVYKVLRGTTGLRESMIQNQARLRVNFQLARIVDWTRHARVLQAERPEQTVLGRMRASAHCELSLTTKPAWADGSP